MIFYVGVFNLNQAVNFDHSFISISRLLRRKSYFGVKKWIADSRAFTEVTKLGDFSTTPEQYAAIIEQWRGCGEMELAVSQDYMCEPFVLSKTGKTVMEHQMLTIERYDRLRAATDAPLMPVIQGYKPAEYIDHLRAYGDRLTFGMRVGVGSICKRNSHPQVIEFLLRKIRAARPDLRLHGFGLKLTALQRPCIRSLLYSADSMAWSFDQWRAGNRKRKQLECEFGFKLTPKEAREICAGRGEEIFSVHDWTKAKAYESRIIQPSEDFHLSHL